METILINGNWYYWNETIKQWAKEINKFEITK